MHTLPLALASRAFLHRSCLPVVLLSLLFSLPVPAVHGQADRARLDVSRSEVCAGSPVEVSFYAAADGVTFHGGYVSMHAQGERLPPFQVVQVPALQASGVLLFEVEIRKSQRPRTRTR